MIILRDKTLKEKQYIKRKEVFEKAKELLKRLLKEKKDKEQKEKKPNAVSQK